MSSTAMPVWRCRSDNSSRIWPRSVTSSAVVGSSASNSLGRLASAMAIMARWRCPPDIWCGKLAARRAGSGMPVLASNSIAVCADWARVRACFSIKTSATCAPTVIKGLSAVMGSWKIMATLLPRTPRNSRSESCSRSRPFSSAWPAMCASPARRSSESALTVLPDPDSPTSANFSPARISKSTPCTTSLSPKRTRRPDTCSSTGALIGRPFAGRAHRAAHHP